MEEIGLLWEEAQECSVLYERTVVDAWRNVFVIIIIIII